MIWVYCEHETKQLEEGGFKKKKKKKSLKVGELVAQAAECKY